MSTAYARPSLCRLCEGPVVANGGVRMAELDLAKLAQWWLQEFETELDDDADALCTNPICQFCLWDARFKSEEEMGAEQETNSKLDWWTDRDINNSYKKYYFKYDIRPCRVVIPRLHVQGQVTPREIGGNTADDSANPKKQPLRKQTDCVCCGETFPTQRAAFWHVTVFHKDVRVFTCRSCVLHFKSRHDRYKHRETCPNTRYLCFKRKQNKMKLKSHTLVCHSQFKETSTNAPKTVKIGQSDNIFLNLVKCIYCNHHIKPKNLSRHCARVHGSVFIRYIYKKCAKFFISESEQQNHIEEVHESQTGYSKCPHCLMKFNAKTFIKHLLIKHPTDIFKCTHKNCSAFFSSKDEQELHISQKRCQSDKYFKCVYCPNSFKRKESLYIHVNVIHAAEKIRCEAVGCKDYFKSESDLNLHVKEVHQGNGSEILKCPQCPNKIFLSAISLYYHKIGNCSSMEKTAVSKCLYCHAMISSTSLKAHIDLKHSSISIKCIYHRCSKYFLNLEEQRRHIKDIHESKPGLIKCPFCLLKYQKTQLRNHLIRVHASESMACSFNNCTSLLCSKEELELHISKFHNGSVKKFTCSYCNKVLASKVTTSRHIRRYHSSEFTDPAHMKLYSCKKCNFQCILPSILRKHVSGVHNSWNNQCQVCSKLFKSIRNLNRHENLSHGELCRHCGALIFDMKKHYSLGKPCKFCSLEMPCGGMKTDHMRTCEKRK